LLRRESRPCQQASPCSMVRWVATTLRRHFQGIHHPARRSVTLALVQGGLQRLVDSRSSISDNPLITIRNNWGNARFTQSPPQKRRFPARIRAESIGQPLDGLSQRPDGLNFINWSPRHLFAHNRAVPIPIANCPVPEPIDTCRMVSSRFRLTNLENQWSAPTSRQFEFK
jgi:hypothetical protein